MDNDDVSIWDCPKCRDGKLIKRTNKIAKEDFLGCSEYPKCKYTQKIESSEEDIKDSFDVWS